MKIRADLKCYYCGFVSGQLEGDGDQPSLTPIFHPAPSYHRPLPKPGERVTCGRCGGPVFLDEVEIVRVRRRVPDDEETPVRTRSAAVSR